MAITGDAERGSSGAGWRLARALFLALMALGAVRTSLFVIYAALAWPLAGNVYYLEGASVHFAWRAAHRQALYPVADGEHAVSNLMGPVYFQSVGAVGRAVDAKIPALYRVGRGVTLLAGVLSTLALAAWIAWRDGWRVGLATGCFGLGSLPTLGFGAMVRPDMLADGLGLIGFLVVMGQGRTVGRVALAAILFALAILTKQTAAVYALAALVGLLVERRTADVARLALTSLLATTALGLATLGLDAQTWRSLVGQSQIPWSVTAWIELLGNLLRFGPDLALAAGLAIGLLWLGRNDAEGQKPRLVLVIVLVGFGLITSLKRGADFNYFLSWRAVEMLAVAELARQVARAPVGRAGATVVASAALLLAMAPALLTTAGALRAVRHDRQLAQDRASEFDSLRRLAQDRSVELLADSDDVAVYQGERAVFVDPYLFRVQVEQRLVDDQPLVRKLEKRRFDWLVLSVDPTRPVSEENLWRLPDRVRAAVVDHYQPERRLAGKQLWRPKDRGVVDVVPSATRSF